MPADRPGRSVDAPMLDPPDVVIGLAATALRAPVVMHRDRSWPHRESTVIEVRGPDGAARIVKQVRSPVSFEREVRALREWAPLLGTGRAPRLLAVVADRSLMIMDRLPGRAGIAAMAAEFHQAGRQTRRLHEVEPTTADPDYPRRAAAGVDEWVHAQLDFVRAQLRLLESMPAVRSGPIHNDNQPRNWLTDEAGTVRLIDFGKAKRDCLLRDMERLQHQEWRGRPDLRDAFFDGYGRTLSDAEERALACIGAVAAVTTILWARHHGDADFERHGRRTLQLLRDAG